MTPIERAKSYLATIQDNSPEDDDRIWFENASYEVKLAAYIILNTMHRDYHSMKPCTCHPSEAPILCQHKYAYSECMKSIKT